MESPLVISQQDKLQGAFAEPIESVDQALDVLAFVVTTDEEDIRALDAVALPRFRIREQCFG
jgi:hypothetical protein